jgi:hypothetical protein
MRWGTYGILIIFGMFILLLVTNPRLSCFGKRIRSPFYPLVRKRKSGMLAKKPPRTEDYGFRLGEKGKKTEADGNPDPKNKTEEYGFRLD